MSGVSHGRQLAVCRRCKGGAASPDVVCARSENVSISPRLRRQPYPTGRMRSLQRSRTLSIPSQVVEEVVDDVQLAGADHLVVDELADREVEHSEAEG